jgi:hypothetical protein
MISSSVSCFSTLRFLWVPPAALVCGLSASSSLARAVGPFVVPGECLLRLARTARWMGTTEEVLP